MRLHGRLYTGDYLATMSGRQSIAEEVMIALPRETMHRFGAKSSELLQVSDLVPGIEALRAALREALLGEVPQ